MWVSGLGWPFEAAVEKSIIRADGRTVGWTVDRAVLLSSSGLVSRCPVGQGSPATSGYKIAPRTSLSTHVQVVPSIGWDAWVEGMDYPPSDLRVPIVTDRPTNDFQPTADRQPISNHLNAYEKTKLHQRISRLLLLTEFISQIFQKTNNFDEKS